MKLRDELKETVAKNRKDRRWFLDYWANYVKTHSDRDWSRQQNVLIDSVIGKKNRINRFK